MDARARLSHAIERLPAQSQGCQSRFEDLQAARMQDENAGRPLFRPVDADDSVLTGNMRLLLDLLENGRRAA